MSEHKKKSECKLLEKKQKVERNQIENEKIEDCVTQHKWHV